MIPAVLEPGGDGATALYIVAFSLFIIGVKRGTHPTTAKQGNLIAAGRHGDRRRHHAAARRDRQLGPDRRSASGSAPPSA